MTLLVLIVLALACAADAYSTVALLKRGGYEKVSEWAIGKYPPAWKVWLWCFVLPVAAGAAVLHYFPALGWVVVIGALIRGYFALRNNRLQR